MNNLHPDPHAHLRAALQYLLDCEGDGFVLANYALALGLERMDSTGEIKSTVWVVSPRDQADYVTDGLLAAAEDMRASADVIDDD